MCICVACHCIFLSQYLLAFFVNLSVWCCCRTVLPFSHYDCHWNEAHLHVHGELIHWKSLPIGQISSSGWGSSLHSFSPAMVFRLSLFGRFPLCSPAWTTNTSSLCQDSPSGDQYQQLSQRQYRKNNLEGTSAETYTRQRYWDMSYLKLSLWALLFYFRYWHIMKTFPLKIC